MLLLNGIAIQSPQVIRVAIDYLEQGGRSTSKLGFYALLMVGIALSKGIFQFLTRWIVIGISRDIEFDLRNDLFQHLERLSFPYYQRTRTGDVMARATNDLNAVRMLLGPAIMYSANTLVFTAGALVYHVQDQPEADALHLSASARSPASSFSISATRFTSASKKSRQCSPTFRRARRRTFQAPA